MALNKLKKWIGTQAMTAFFDQLNDNVDATNAAIDAVDAKANKEQEPWKPITLLNGWENTFGTAQYFKDEFGMVHCKGYIGSGTTAIGTVLFTVPSEYRTASVVFVYANRDASTMALFRVNTNGEVSLGSSGGDVMIFTFSYRAVV